MLDDGWAIKGILQRHGKPFCEIMTSTIVRHPDNFGNGLYTTIRDKVFRVQFNQATLRFFDEEILP